MSIGVILGLYWGYIGIVKKWKLQGFGFSAAVGWACGSVSVQGVYRDDLHVQHKP